MCRFLVASLRGNRKSLRIIDSLLNAFHMASKKDPYLEELTGGAANSHCDGYGYALALQVHSSWKIIYERYDAVKAGYPCRVNLQSLKEDIMKIFDLLKEEAWKQAVLILHSRKASSGEPRGIMAAHPYYGEASTSDGLVGLFLAHNGSINKNLVSTELGQFYSCTDSCILHKYMLKELARGVRLRQAIQRASRFTRSTLNLGIMTVRMINSGEIQLESHAIAGWSKEIFTDDARSRYYTLYMYRDANVRTVFSSSLACYINSRLNLIPVEPTAPYKPEIIKLI